MRQRQFDWMQLSDTKILSSSQYNPLAVKEEKSDVIITFTNECDDSTIPIVETSIEARLLNKASWFSCYSNLTSTIIGAGILGLPYAFAKTGWLMGLVLLTLCGLSSCMALQFLALCAKKTNSPSSFYSVAEIALPKVSYLIDVAVAIKCYGVATSYLIVIGDLMPTAMSQLHSTELLRNRTFWVVFGFCIAAPLSCFQSLDALKYTSSVSILFVVFLTILVILYASHMAVFDPCAGDTPCSGSVEYANLDMNTLKVLSIFVFAYTCQQNAFSVANELQSPTSARVNSVYISSIATAYTLYVIVASLGYYTYGDNTLSDLLKNYPESPITSAARIFVSLIVAFHYPLQANPARKCVMTLIRNINHGVEAPAWLYSLQYCAVTVVFLATSLLIAATVQDLGIIIALVGATGSTAVSYILPGAFYYSLYRGEGPVWMTRVAVLQFAVGLCIIPVCLTFILSS